MCHVKNMSIISTNIKDSFWYIVCLSSRKLEVWLSLGGFHERGHDWESDRRLYNSHIIINDKGGLRWTNIFNPQSMFPTWCTQIHTRTDTLSFHPQVTSFQFTGRHICLMWNCRRKEFPLKKVPSSSLDPPSCPQSRLPLERCHFLA